jgi:serine protease 16
MIDERHAPCVDGGTESQAAARVLARVERPKRPRGRPPAVFFTLQLPQACKMIRIVPSVLAPLLLTSGSSAIPTQLGSVSYLPTSLEGSDDAAVRLALQGEQGNADRLPLPQYVSQEQDHFDGTNSKQWNQAYYVNDTFWVPGSDAPIFVCVGGEGPALTGASVVASVHCSVASQWLAETKALMFGVEHRYYGCHNASACPVDSMSSTADLKYLSSRQALGDLAHFKAFATEQYSLTDKNKWVSFGGSYPGMLAGWFRLKFPHLVHASIASSAPVKAKVDMNEYNDVTAAAYGVSDNGVGGSPECTKAIADGHAQIGTMFTTATGRAKLAKLFGHTAEYYASRENQGALPRFLPQITLPPCI